MDPSLFTVIHWEPAASPDYMADVIVTKHSKPTVRSTNLKPIGGNPNFIVLRTKEIFRGFDGGSPRNADMVKTLEIVLMDGSFTCFVARINTGIMKKLHDTKLIPGCKLTVLDHEFIWLYDFDELIKRRVVMFIKDFEWEFPPLLAKFPEAVENDSWRCPDLSKDRFLTSVIDSILTQKTVVALNYSMEVDCSWYWDDLSDDGMYKGYWIQNEETKRLWKDFLDHEKNKRRRIYKKNLQTNASEDDPCDCMDVFGFRGCVLEMYPVGRVCRKDVYDQVYHRLSGSVKGDHFDELKPNHKRWAMYWYYSVNILGVTGKQRKKLPNCFVKYIRNRYPDPVGQTYTGFRSLSGSTDEESSSEE